MYEREISLFNSDTVKNTKRTQLHDYSKPRTTAGRKQTNNSNIMSCESSAMQSTYLENRGLKTMGGSKGQSKRTSRMTQKPRLSNKRVKSAAALGGGKSGMRMQSNRNIIQGQF